jgi:MFS family permease
MGADAMRRSRSPAFTNRDFRLYWWARVLGRLAVELQITGVSWQVYALTKDPFDLGLVGLAQFAPFLLFFLLAGAAADRLPRAKLLGGCIVLETVCSLLLFGLTLTSTVTFWRIFVVLVLLGIARAFQSPAQQAIVPVLTPRAHFANAIAWTATGTQLARIGGPALAGGLLILGQVHLYATALGCFLMAAALTFLIRADTQIISRERPTWSTLLAGFRFIWSRQLLLGVIVLDLFAVLLGGATALLPIYAADILHVGTIGFGSLRTAHMAGAFLCALVMTQRQITRRAGPILLSSVAIFGAAIVVFGLSTSFWLSLTALFILGAADAISVFIRGYVVQMRTPDEMRGRVSAVNAVFIGASNELGEFESGITAAWWGVVPAVVVGGLGTIGVTALFAWLLPQLRTLDHLDQDDLDSS